MKNNTNDRIEKSELDVLSAIATRYSVRRFTDEPVGESQINTLLNAGFCAPSAMNSRPWDFVVVRDREKLNRFAEKGRYQKMLFEAPLAIIVCGRERRLANHDLLVNDCSAAVENILLAAHGIGLGACWCGLVQTTLIRFTREQLSLPDDVLPAALIAIGHPAEQREQPERFNPKHIHYEVFGGKEDD